MQSPLSEPGVTSRCNDRRMQRSQARGGSPLSFADHFVEVVGLGRGHLAHREVVEGRPVGVDRSGLVEAATRPADAAGGDTAGQAFAYEAAACDGASRLKSSTDVVGLRFADLIEDR